MLISYQSLLLQEICFQSSIAIQHLEEKAAVCLQARLSDIQAASNVFELLIGQVAVEGNLCILTVPDVLSIVMTPNYSTAEGDVLYDWSTVGRIKVMRINDVK